MELSPQEKEIREFSWPMLFIVTGCCAFIFSITLKFLDGTRSPLLIKFGIAMVSLGLVVLLIKKLAKTPVKKKSSLQP